MREYNYHEDPMGRACLEQAHRCKSDMRFGAVLVKEGKIIGRGWNRLSTREERAQLSHVDYSIHAEQACILDALDRGEEVAGAAVYVLGYSNKAKTRGHLSVRDGAHFTCRKCPHALKKYGVTVFIPHISGWLELTADEALESARQHQGYWSRFIAGENSGLLAIPGVTT